MAGNESESCLYQVMLERCLSLEASQAKLREDVDRLLQERPMSFLRKEAEEEAAASWAGADSRFYFAVSSYRSLLDSLGHAVCVSSPSSGQITYWSRSAKRLYHWDAKETVGQKMVDVLVPEEYRNSLRNIMKKVCSGQTWCGQFPFHRRSGEQFMALVAKSPMYEDGELVGVITVSSDAALFNRMHPPHEKQCQPHGRGRASILKKIQWHLPRPQIAAGSQTAAVPITSSVSHLTSKVSKLLPRRHEDNSSNESMSSGGRDENGTEVAYTMFEKSVSLADKFLAKLQSKIIGNHGNEDDTSILQNGNKKLSGCTVIDKSVFSQAPKASSAVTSSNFRDNVEDKPKMADTGFSDVYGNGTGGLIKERTMVTPAGECCQYFEQMNQRESPAQPGSYMISDALGAKMSTLNGEIEVDLMTRPNGDPFPGPVGIISSQQSPSSKVNNELNAVSSCEIRWEDLQLREEVGQGSFAVVYRGIWNGSDVAVKVYFGGDYKVGTWLDCKKEIDIMKKLRHPNVLLFMGAVYSQERFAIVTEFLPRGSLFKILHNANQPLDMKRRLRMALDIARGMNYLHRRNPPIVHRDLKSSNLLVDRNWNVKVGDFGLSKWKNATFLSTKSGKGTPQWMAPEVLRNEPSNEKSDVFSFGVILWELMTVSVPWDHLNCLQVVGVVGFMDRRLDLPEGLNPRIGAIIRDCWHNDPGKRPSFEEIIARMANLFRKRGAGEEED